MNAWFPGLAAAVVAGWAIASAALPTASAHSEPEFFRKLEYEPPAPGSYDLPVIQRAVDGEVLDVEGRTRRLFDALGEGYALLSFIYTSCSDAKGCPLATHVMREVARYVHAHAELGDELQIVSLSFDPERDTPEAMRRYSRAGDSADPLPDDAMAFYTTASRAQLEPILDGYGQYIVPERGPEGGFTGLYSHVLKVFLIDPQRNVRNIYSVSYLYPQLILNDVRTLLMDSRAGTVAAPGDDGEP